MKLTRTNLALIIAVLVLPTAALGQDEDVSTEVSPNGEATETIRVASNKSPGALRRDLWRAEKKFYSLYNKLNDDSLYDVSCTKDAPTGSVIPVQTCRPEFLDRAIREGEIKSGSNPNADPDLARKIATFRENMAVLISENPDLQSAVATLNSAHAQVEADKERRAKN